MFPNAIFSIGEKIHVHWYGVLISIGILAAFLVLTNYSRILHISEKLTDFVYYNGLFAIAAGFGASALFQGLYDYIENPAGGFHIGGITFLGGLIGGAASFLIVYCFFWKKLDATLFEALPVIPCMITVGHAFGRMGCFCAGCCYGKVSDSVLAVQFPRLSQKVLPTQLFEAVFLFILFGVLTYLLLRWKFRYTMTVYCVSYGIFRFILEFYRGDHRGEFIGGITPSQTWALVLLPLGALAFFWQRSYLKKKAEAEAASESETVTDGVQSSQGTEAKAETEVQNSESVEETESEDSQ